MTEVMRLHRSNRVDPISQLEDIGRREGVYFTAAELMRTRFPSPRWAVSGLIAEGLTLLVGPPKFGKSWLCLGLGVAVASGGLSLGKIPTDPGPVLYASLEDTPRRVQQRLDLVLGDDLPPEDLHVVTALPRMPLATEILAGWLTAHPAARLVIVDVLRKIRPIADGRGNAYNEDYDTLTALKDLADRFGVAVVVVHHTRKAVDDGDVFNEVSGSTGLTGAADAILVAKRARNSADGVLHITGRDVPERELGLSWSDDQYRWTLLDEPAAVATMPPTQRKIFDHLAALGGDTPKGIVSATGLPQGTVKPALKRMLDRGSLDTDGHGTYFPASQPAVKPETPETEQPEVSEFQEFQSSKGSPND